MAAPVAPYLADRHAQSLSIPNAGFGPAVVSTTSSTSDGDLFPTPFSFSSQPSLQFTTPSPSSVSAIFGGAPIPITSSTDNGFGGSGASTTSSSAVLFGQDDTSTSFPTAISMPVTSSSVVTPSISSSGTTSTSTSAGSNQGSAQPQAQSPNSTSQGGLSNGAIAAAVVVPVVVVALIALLIFFLLRRRRRRRNTTREDDMTSHPSEKRNGPTQNGGPPQISALPGQPDGFGMNDYQVAGLDATKDGASSASNPFGDSRSVSTASNQFIMGSSPPTQTEPNTFSPGLIALHHQPQREVSPQRPRTGEADDDDAASAVSDVSYQQAEVGVAQRASVITMNGLPSHAS